MTLTTYVEASYFPTYQDPPYDPTTALYNEYNYEIYSQSGRRAALFDYSKCNNLRF